MARHSLLRVLYLNVPHCAKAPKGGGLKKKAVEGKKEAVEKTKGVEEKRRWIKKKAKKRGTVEGEKKRWWRKKSGGEKKRRRKKKTWNIMTMRHNVSWIYFLSHCGADASVNDSVRTRTDTTIDQDCVLKATVQVCMIVSLLTTCLYLTHSSSPAGCTVSMQNSRVKRGSNTGHKIQQALLPADLGLCNSTIPSLVICILAIPECRSDHHGSCASSAWSRQSVCSLYSTILAHPWVFKVLCQISLWRQLVFTKFLTAWCSCFAPCSCLAHCCHDPFIARSASNLSTVPWFHSVYASVSMFAITDNCLFLFLFLSLSLGRCLCFHEGLCANVMASSSAQIEATTCS